MDDNRDYIEIDLLELFYVFRAKIVTIILVALVTAAAAASYSVYLLSPKYEATSTLYITNQSTSITDYLNLQMSTVLTKDYEELILGRPVVETVIRNLGLDSSYEGLKENVSVKNPEDTRIISITVTNTDPVKARDIANEFANVARKHLSKIMDTDEPNIAESAVIPEKKSSPNNTKNTIIGFILGALLAMAVITIKYLADDTLKDPDDVEKYLNLTVLASIPYDEKSDMDKSKGKRKNRKHARKEGR